MDCNKEYAFFTKWSDVVSNYYDDPGISIDLLASHMCLCKRQLYNRVVRNTGLSPKKYLDEYRVKCSMELLVGTNFSISRISDKSGFSNSSVYSKVFKKNTGLSPKEYRKGKL